MWVTLIRSGEKVAEVEMRDDVALALQRRDLFEHDGLPGRRYVIDQRNVKMGLRTGDPVTITLHVFGGEHAEI